MAILGKQQKEGFSLVEMIIAISVLAVLSLPIIAFFTNSHVYTEKGMSEQRANIAAQSVMEELNRYAKFGQLENIEAIEQSEIDKGILSEKTWTLDNKAIDGIDAEKSSLTKKITMDGIEYLAKVTVDYAGYKESPKDGSGLPISNAKYNKHPVPELNEIYSPENVIFAESDQQEIAISDIYHSLQATKSKATIIAGVKRTLYLDVTTTSENGNEIYIVKGYYHYDYNGTTYDSVIDTIKIEKSALKRIYFFYNPLRDNLTEESVFVSYDSGVDAEKLSVYYIVQENGISLPAGYHLAPQGSGEFLKSYYYTNGVAATTFTHFSNSEINHRTGKRIAKVTISMYHDGTTEFKEENCLATIDSTKSE